MQIRWKAVGLAAVVLVGLATFLTYETAAADAPQAEVQPRVAPLTSMMKRAPTSPDAGGLSIPETVSAINSATPMSQRVVHYEIDAKYDADKHIVEGSEVLTYHNLTGEALDHFPFHLYQNAFEPKATWVREAKIAGTRDVDYEKWEDKRYGSEEIKSLEVEGQGDLTSELQYIQPDDGNKDDKTVIEVHLNQPVAPGAYVQFKIVFKTQFPETQARSGWKRDFTLGGQWFPKVGVWWQGAWNCHQYHAMTEFFADFGVYDVKLTVPQREVIGATGIEVSNVNNPDNTKTVTYHGDDIHDFAWTTSPRYKVKEDGVFQGQMGPVKMRVMMQPAHWSQVDRHEKILRESLEYFEKWYGPYPYKTITLVDPEPGSAAGGMEYPTFITGDSAWLMPEGIHLVELVVEHEFGHQYWYGMVATNEFEDAWLDEGLNSYTEVKVNDAVLGQGTSVFDFHGITAGERDFQRIQFIGVADADPLAQKAYEYYSYGSYGGITYGKTASVLLTLEGIIGEDTMQKAMQVYFMKYRFTHPTKEDFLKTVEEVSGKDLRWYFNQAIYGSRVLDYRVAKIESSPVDWYQVKDGPGATGKDDKGKVYRSYVWVRRKEDFLMPVEVEIKFDNGEKIRERWDGQSRWTRLGPYEKKAKVVSAEIDPDHKIYLDRNNFDNSRLVEENAKPASKLTNYWMFVCQLLGQALTWWAV